MKRGGLIIALLALIVALLGARRIEAVVDNRGVWRVEFWTADGPMAHRISAGEYERLRKGGACLPSSHYSAWPTSRALTVICEV